MKLQAVILAICCIAVLPACEDGIPPDTSSRSVESSTAAGDTDRVTGPWYSRVTVPPATAALVDQAAEQDADITDEVRSHARGNAGTVMAERLGLSPEAAAGLEFIVGEPQRLYTLDLSREGALFDAMVPSDVYRVPIIAGSDRAEEYDLRLQGSGTWMAFSDGACFLTALESALYELWDGLDEARFRYRLLWESEEGVWVIGTDGDRAAGVFLGRCMEGTADTTALSTPAKPGKVYVGGQLDALVRARVGEASGQ